MRSLRLPQFLLQSRLLLSRFGWDKMAILLLTACALATWLVVIPRMEAELKAQQAAIGKLQALKRTEAPSVPAVTLPVPERRLQNFYQVLGQNGYQEQQLKTLFAIAAKNGLALSQAEYKLAHDQDGHFHTYRISLPLKGSYAAIRQFCEQVLEAIPFASLNDINFKRDSIGNAMLEARISITLYLADADAATKRTSRNPDS